MNNVKRVGEAFGVQALNWAMIGFAALLVAEIGWASLPQATHAPASTEIVVVKAHQDRLAQK